MTIQYKKLSNGMVIKYSIFDKLKKIITKSKPVESKPVGVKEALPTSFLWAERKAIQHALLNQGEENPHTNKGLTNKAIVGVRKVIYSNPEHPDVQLYHELKSHPQIGQTHSGAFNKLVSVMGNLIPIARETDPIWKEKYLENKAFHDKLAENVVLNSSIPANTNLKSSIPADSHPTSPLLSIKPAIDEPLSLLPTLRKGKSTPSFVEKGEIPISTLKGKGRTKGEMGVGGKRHQFIAKQLSDGVPPNEIVQNLAKEFLLTPKQAAGTYRQFKIKAKLRRILSEIKYKYSRIKYAKDSPFGFAPHQSVLDTLLHLRLKQEFENGKIKPGVAFDLTPHAESLLHSDLGAFAKKPDVQHLLGKTATMDADGKIHIIDPNSLDKTHVSSVPVKTQTEKQKQLTDELDKKLDEIMKRNHLPQKPQSKPLVQVNKHPAKIVEPSKPTGQVSLNPPQIKLPSPTPPQVSKNPPNIIATPTPLQAKPAIAKPKLPVAKPPQPETAKRADTIGNHPTTVAAAISREAKPFVPIKTPSFIPRQLKPHEDMEFQEGDPVIHSISPEGERHVFVPNAGPKNNALKYATDALQAAGHHILGNRGLTQEEADHINRSGQHPHTVTYPLKEFMDKANQMGITPNSGSPKKTKGPDVRKPRKANKPPTEERQQWSRNTLDKIDYMADRLLEKIA